MKWDKIFDGTVAVYLIGASAAGLWWAADLTRQVTTLNGSTVTAERIATLETEVRNLGDSTRELKVSINDLVRELKRNN